VENTEVIWSATDLESWIDGQDHIVGVIVASRAALRVVPGWIGLHNGTNKRWKQDTLIALFRGMATLKLYCENKISEYFVHKSQIQINSLSYNSDFRKSEKYSVCSANSAASALNAISKVDYTHICSGTVEYARQSYLEFINRYYKSHLHRIDMSNYSWLSITSDAKYLSNGDYKGLINQKVIYDFREKNAFGGDALVKSVLLYYKMWDEFCEYLKSLNADWQVWVQWWEAARDGHAPWGLSREVANDVLVEFLTWPDENWQRSPGEVNAYIQGIIDAARNPTEPIEPIPQQGLGPHFKLGDDDRIERQQASELDADGNDIGRIRQLRPLVLKCANNLLERLSRNEFPELIEAVDSYRSKLDPPEDGAIGWGEVWGLGVILENAAAAAARDIAARSLPELEDPAKSALESLLTLHGPMVLATREARELAQIADDYALTREETARVAAAARTVAASLGNSPEIIDPALAKQTAEAVAAMGAGPHPERGAVYGTVSIKHVSIVLVAAAVAASPAFAGFLVAGAAGAATGAFAGSPLTIVTIEALKKSAAFGSIVTALGKQLDRMSDTDIPAFISNSASRLAPFRAFVIANEVPLREIAKNSNQLNWMMRYIDFVCSSEVDQRG
jgi:hypothetical protein